MTLRACPLCGYRYNAPENQTCGKCKGWLGGAETAAVALNPQISTAAKNEPNVGANTSRN